MVIKLFWTWQCTRFNSIPVILKLPTKRNIALIYSVTICEQKTKDCARLRSFQHKLQHHFFQLRCLPAFLAYYYDSSTNYVMINNFSLCANTASPMQCIQKFAWICQSSSSNPRSRFQLGIFNPVLIYLITLWFSFFGDISLVSKYQHYLSIIYFFPQYHQLTVSDDYFENKIAMNKMLVQKNFGMLRHPVNKDM